MGLQEASKDFMKFPTTCRFYEYRGTSEIYEISSVSIDLLGVDEDDQHVDEMNCIGIRKFD